MSFNPNIPSKQYDVSTLVIGNDRETVIGPATDDGRITFAAHIEVPADIPHYKEAEEVIGEQYGLSVASQRHLGRTAEGALLFMAMPHLGAIDEDAVNRYPLNELLDQASDNPTGLHPDDAEILRRFNEQRNQ